MSREVSLSMSYTTETCFLTSLQLTDQGLSFLLKQNPNLEVLDIDHCPLLTGATVRSVTQVRRQIAVDLSRVSRLAT